MSVDRGSDQHGVDRASEVGSEAIANASQNQQQNSGISGQVSPLTSEPAVEDLNNALQLLAPLLADFDRQAGDPSALWSVEDAGEAIAAAARRIRSAVGKLTPAPRRPCRNCGTLNKVDPVTGDLRCMFCDQLERAGVVVFAGERPYRQEPEL